MGLAALFEDLDRGVPEGLAAVEAVASLVFGPPACSEPVHPLVVPFARDEEADLGVLVWPTAPEGWPVPVVRSRGARLELLAGSVADFGRHVLARLEAGGRLEGDVEAAGASLYEPGDRAQTGLELLPWVILKAGGAPWAYAAARDGHLRRGDAASALIAAERACERFAGWAELHAWRMRLLQAAGRDEEAREAATAALALPVWTLMGPFEEVAVTAGWRPPISAAPFHARADADAVAPADRAAYLMDATALEGRPWHEVRARLADWYEGAGLAGIATLVRTPRLG